MSASVDRLRDTFANASGQLLTLEYISRIAQLLRHVVQEESAKQRLPVLQLYCYWLLHPKIDQSATADNILATIDDIFFVRQRVTTLSPQNVQSAMGFGILRSQLGSLLQSHGLPDELVTNDARWKEFVLLVVRDLCTKPLTFSQPRGGRNSNRILDDVLNAAGVNCRAICLIGYV
jgi:hypothetical protein